MIARFRLVGRIERLDAEGEWQTGDAADVLRVLPHLGRALHEYDAAESPVRAISYTVGMETAEIELRWSDSGGGSTCPT